MKVSFKNIKEFQSLILKSGHTLRSLSITMGFNASFLAIILKRNAISPQSAKKICDFLKIEFDEIFLINASSNDDKKTA